MKFVNLIAAVLLPLCCTTQVVAAKKNETLRIFGDALLRYENETRQINLVDRERLRLIARLGVHYKLNNTWQFTGRLRTGLKDKQNVPAVTLYKFTDQPTPDNDVYIDRLYATGLWHNKKLLAGKIPWSSWQNTDMFWDRDLNPLGIHLEHKFNNHNKISLMLAKPLDGASGLVGKLFVAQWQYSTFWEDWDFKIAPWWVSYRGEANAQFARKDTQLDNQFARLALNAKYQNWSFGLDVGHSLESFSAEEFGEFADDKTSIATEIKYGNLKEVGAYQAHLRYLHVERFGVITEFAQNATQRFGTNDIAGWDFRLRRKMDKNWWLGMRFSQMSRLTGKDEQGNRFRIEVQYRF